MYKLLVILLSLNAASARQNSKPKEYMVCLGKEEAMIHKKNIGGPVYRLNQDVISSLVQLRETISMKERYIKEICGAPYPSVKFLELLMTEGHIFYSRKSEKRDPKDYTIDQAALQELKRSSAPLFVSFITGLQAGLKKANCLRTLLPELRPFIEDMLYLQENLDVEQILKSIKRPKKVFEKLQKLDAGPRGLLYARRKEIGLIKNAYFHPLRASLPIKLSSVFLI